MLEYRVLTQRDQIFSGAYDTDALERVLNDHAAQGWRLAGSFLANSLWKRAKSEIVMIMERSVDGPGSP